MVLSVGIFNALMNILLWTIHAIVGQLMEDAYIRISRWELKRKGNTLANDCSEVYFHKWLFDRVKRKKTEAKFAKWALMLMLLLLVLVPAEIYFEAGVEERDKCTPRQENSTGVCALPWKGVNDVKIAASVLMTLRYGWSDKEWTLVWEGSRRQPRSREVRVGNPKIKGRRVLASACSVSVRPCSSDASCGNLTVLKTAGAFTTIVTGASITGDLKGKFSHGDLTFDGATSLGFLFWEGETRTERGKRNTISSLGIETVLIPPEMFKYLRLGKKPDFLSLKRARTRLYRIQCETDGLQSKDITRALSLFRTMQMEQPGLRQDHVKSNLSRIQPLTPSDVLKAVYAIKAEDGSRNCQGMVDVYETCGGVKLLSTIPFTVVCSAIVLFWITVYILSRVRWRSDESFDDAIRQAEEAVNSGKFGSEAALYAQSIEVNSSESPTPDGGERHRHRSSENNFRVTRNADIDAVARTSSVFCEP